MASKFKTDDVEISHRLPANKQGETTIIARFWDYKIKQNLYRNVTLNSIFPGMSEIDGQVYINENLRVIYSNCLKLRREGKIHSVWTMDGTIFA